MNLRDNDPTRDDVTVAVSSSRSDLRNIQKELNWFLWSSELAYGFALTSLDGRLQNDDENVLDALKDVASVAWYPNYQGSPKYRAKVSTFRDQLRRNTTHVYRSVLISWYSYFERYLETRVRPYVGGRKPWGSLLSTLYIPELVESRYPVRARAVLLADLIRVIRNEMVHAAFATIDNITHEKIQRWKTESVACLRERWHYRDPEAGVTDALKYVFELAAKQRALKQSGHDLPLEHFYVLYAFSNLDKLTFEIEEALIQNKTDEPGRLRRNVHFIRRTDLIVPDAV